MHFLRNQNPNVMCDVHSDRIAFKFSGQSHLCGCLCVLLGGARLQVNNVDIHRGKYLKYTKCVCLNSDGFFRIQL